MPAATDLPSRFEDEAALEDFMTAPSAALIGDLSAIDGDVMILGVGGKMGPTLARLARRAAPSKRIVGVARFSDPAVREALAAYGIETITCDLLDRAAVAALPRVPNVIYMAGRKFGTTGAEHLTWAMNAHAPAIVAETFTGARILAHAFGERFGKAPAFAGTEAPAAWLVNTGEAQRLFGYPVVPLGRMIDWTADWVARDLPSLGKATHYEVREGSF